MTRYINPPAAPQSPIKNLHYGTPSRLDQPKSHANVHPKLGPEDVSMWESMNLGKNAANTMARLAGLQTVNKEAERIVHPEQASSLGAPDQYTRNVAKEQGALGVGQKGISGGHPQDWSHAHDQSTRRYASSSPPAVVDNSPAVRGLPARGGHQPNVGSAYSPAISSQAALERGTTQVPRYGIVQATHDKGDRMGRRTLEAGGQPAGTLLPGPEETRNRARAAQQRTFKDRAPRYEQGSMF